MEIHPNNTISSYTTQLHTPLELEGEWQVGLVEASIPTRWMTEIGEVYIYIQYPAVKGQTENIKSRWVKERVQLAGFDSPFMLIQAINTAITNNIIKENKRLESQFDNPPFGHHERLEYYPVKNTVNLITSAGKKQVAICARAAALLGYGDGQGKKWTKITGEPDRPIDISGGWSHIYIYSDVVKHVPVGDTVSPLLRVVSLPSRENITFSPQYTHIFSDVHYSDVSRRFFETIQVDLRTDTGEKVPFALGKSVIKLHFRPKRYL